MPIISAVGLFCIDKFEDNQTRKCLTFFRMSKFTKPYFKYECGTHSIQRNPVGVTGKMVSGYTKVTCSVAIYPIPSREDINLDSKNLNFKSNPGSYQMVYLPTGKYVCTRVSLKKLMLFFTF